MFSIIPPSYVGIKNPQKQLTLIKKLYNLRFIEKANYSKQDKVRDKIDSRIVISITRDDVMYKFWGISWKNAYVGGARLL